MNLPSTISMAALSSGKVSKELERMGREVECRPGIGWYLLFLKILGRLLYKISFTLFTIFVVLKQLYHCIF
jgi:hypothetical protein